MVNIPEDENGNLIPINYEDAIIIDELIYKKIIKYLCVMFNLHFKVERAKNKATKEAMIWEDEMNLNTELQKKEKRDIPKSFLLPLISSMVNHPGFKYKTSELKQINIFQFMDSVQRLQIYESTHALLGGMYSGFCDTSKIDKDEFNFMRDIRNKN